MSETKIPFYYEDEIEETVGRGIEPASEYPFEEMDHLFEKYCRKAAAQSHNYSQDKQQLALSQPRSILFYSVENVQKYTVHQFKFRICEYSKYFNWISLE